MLWIGRVAVSLLNELRNVLADDRDAFGVGVSAHRADVSKERSGALDGVGLE